MRESSSEKDLKRLMGNVNLQLEAIKRGYATFKDSQLELVKQYPSMVKEELKKYEENLYKFFSILKTSKHLTNEQQHELQRQFQQQQQQLILQQQQQQHLQQQQQSTSSQSFDDQPDSFRHILKEVLSTNKGTKFYVTMRSLPVQTPSVEQQQQIQSGDHMTVSESGGQATTTIATAATATMTDGGATATLTDDYSNDLLAYDELIPNTRPEILNNVENKNHLKHALIPVDNLKEIRHM